MDKFKASCGMVLISFLPGLSFSIQSFGKNTIVHVGSGSDVAMLIEVFIENHYELPNDFIPKTILDLGANVGFSALYFTLKYPLAKIIAVEPNPENLKIFSKNTASYNSIQIMRVAVSSSDGTRDFFVTPRQGMSSSFLYKSGSQKLEVPTFSLQEIIEQSGETRINLVKFDIEGAEWEVFSKSKLNSVDALIGEYHEDLAEHPVDDFVKLFGGFKTTVKKIFPKRYLVYITREVVTQSL